MSFAMADDAPLAQSPDLTTGLTYSATLPDMGADGISGAVLGSISPDGTGTNFQVSFYNLPGGDSLSYGLYTGKVSATDCSAAGAILDPFSGGTTNCEKEPASCQVGALSLKHGAAKIIGGGAGTGYFADNYVDKYVSMDPSDQAFFGKGSIVVNDVNGAPVACANFINASKVSSKGNSTNTDSSSMAMSSTTGSSGGPTGSSQQTGGSSGSSSSSTGGAVMRTAAPIAGVLGMAALLI
ncbi:Cell surface superoxide dismutase [Cu-Zn] 4 [Saxophila tyrrhenica]|uniref:Cell surface superoxide dismutase [Cu-Zn] 4 n=1 Tax=Saxophila tyrrhenica TaxID=1690608 RepID=A0AAV9NYV5_9PEZI|nr:Cell surface superoxide dismutase [Cu-Zn] 4 [Saxophila tyrrhenica]